MAKQLKRHYVEDLVDVRKHYDPRLKTTLPQLWDYLNAVMDFATQDAIRHTIRQTMRARLAQCQVHRAEKLAPINRNQLRRLFSEEQYLRDLGSVPIWQRLGYESLRAYRKERPSIRKRIAEELRSTEEDDTLI